MVDEAYIKGKIESFPAFLYCTSGEIDKNHNQVVTDVINAAKG
jgi:hypothetical protein